MHAERRLAHWLGALRPGPACSRRTVRRGLRARREDGFSFLEVLMALSILLVGSVAVLSLFTIGVNEMVQRRIDARIDQVRSEVRTIVEEALAKTPAGQVPAPIPPTAEAPPHPLSARGYGLRVTFQPSRFGGAGLIARAAVTFDQDVVRVLVIPLQPTTVAVPTGGAPTGGRP